MPFRKPNRSYYVSAYYHYLIDRQHELKPSDNEDMGGSWIEDNLDIAVVLLRLRCPADDDLLFVTISDLTSVWSI